MSGYNKILKDKQVVLIFDSEMPYVGQLDPACCQPAPDLSHQSVCNSIEASDIG
jgi:hypothetical protein